MTDSEATCVNHSMSLWVGAGVIRLTYQTLHLSLHRDRPDDKFYCMSGVASEADEMEITPEMIKAGIEAYSLFESCDLGEWVVPAIYSAMRKAAISNRGGELPLADECCATDAPR